MELLRAGITVGMSTELKRFTTCRCSLIVSDDKASPTQKFHFDPMLDNGTLY